jgi:hypothetical protein
MGPNDFRRRDLRPGMRPHQNSLRPPQPRPAHPAPQQPLNDLTPRPALQNQPRHPNPHPNHRPTHDFSPRQGVSAHTVLTPRPAAMPQPAIMPQPHPSKNGHYKEPDDYVTLNAQAAAQKNKKEKRRLNKVNKIVLAVVVAVLVVGSAFMLLTSNKSAPKTVQAKPRAAPLVAPTFSVYYPKTLPAGLSSSKSSVTYSKESFTFIIKQGGQNQFFVYERPASTDPDFGSLKTSLVAPKNISLTTGPGISGGLNTGVVTAVKIDNTMVIINSLNTNNDATAKNILSGMQVTNDVSSLRQSSF